MFNLDQGLDMFRKLLSCLPIIFCLTVGCHQQSTPHPSALEEPHSAQQKSSPEAHPLSPPTDVSPPIPARNCEADIRITEVMYDPYGTLDALSEYLEIFNAGTESVRMHGWKLSNGRRESFLFQEETRLEPGQFAILSASLDPDENGDIPADIDLKGFSLANQGSLLHLQNPCGETVTRFRYGTKPPWPNAKAGVAIELLSPRSDPSDPRQWQHAFSFLPSGDRGTPGFHKQRSRTPTIKIKTKNK
jgi:hypothetical protein